MSDDERRFRFDQLDQTGILLGLGPLQLVLLGVGLVGAALAVSAGSPGPVAMIPLGLGAAVAFGRVHGRPATEWLPVIIGWSVAGRTRGRRWIAPIPRTTATGETASIPWPTPLNGLTIVEAPSPWHRMAKLGLVHDKADETLTVLVPVRGQDFALLERRDQEDLLGRWGEVLAAFTRERGLVVRLSWSEFAAPVGLGEHRRWLDDLTEHDPDADAVPMDPTRAAAVISYEQLLAGAGSMTAEHQVIVAITVGRSRLRSTRRSRQNAGDAFTDASIGATEALLRGLRNAGLEPGTPLTAVEIAGVLRGRSDGDQMRRRIGGADVTALDVGHAGPLATHTEWTHHRVDGSLHRTYWIAEWPRLPVPADWMEPLLAFTGRARRAITVIYEPVAPSSSQRRIDSESIKLESDAMAKEDKGRRVSAQHRRHQVAVAEREQELVAGFVEFDFTGLITVSAATEDEMWEGCDHIDQLAREHGLELRALDGRHDVAWATALPFGLGLGRTSIR